MEIIEVTYFLEVARLGSIHRAADGLGVSPSAISKAVSRLEASLEARLIEKVGRNIRLSDQGQRLAVEGAELIALRKKIIESYSHSSKNIFLKIVGPELPLSRYATPLISKIKKKYPNLIFQLEHTSNECAQEQLNNYTADLAIFCSQSKLSGKFYNKIDEVNFKLFASKSHPLARVKEILKAEDILDENFITVDSSRVGEKSSTFSIDGWRDDKLKRKNVLYTSSLKCLESVVLDGLALAYLPSYYGESLELKAINVSNCPYVCKQNIYIGRNKYGLADVWSAI